LDGLGNIIRVEYDVMRQVCFKHGTLRNQQRALGGAQQMRVVALEHRGCIELVDC
jgi:hypothetical protein